MKVAPSTIPGVDLIAPSEQAFREALALADLRTPIAKLEIAIPFSVIVANRSDRAVALLGVRFDMLDRKNKPCSVVHYADTLRNPEKPGLPPAAQRFVCAEAAYTALAVEGREPPATRTRLNLDNLRAMRQIHASLDCVAFADGEFAGPDTLGAYARLGAERTAEMEFMGQFAKLSVNPAEALTEVMKAAANGDRVMRAQARSLLEAFAGGGLEAMLGRARSHRARIELRRR